MQLALQMHRLREQGGVLEEVQDFLRAGGERKGLQLQEIQLFEEILLMF